MMPDWHHWAIQDGHQIQDDRQNKAYVIDLLIYIYKMFKRWHLNLRKSLSKILHQYAIKAK